MFIGFPREDVNVTSEWVPALESCASPDPDLAYRSLERGDINGSSLRKIDFARINSLDREHGNRPLPLAVEVRPRSVCSRIVPR